MFEVMYTVMAVVTMGLAMAVPLSRMRKNRLLRQEAARRHEELVSWARQHGWHAVEGIDLRYNDLAERITGLTGEPGDWELKIGKKTGGPDHVESFRKWVYGSLVTRETAAGRMVIVGCWHEEESSHHLFAGLGTDGVFAPYTLDSLGRGAVHEQGGVPLLDPGAPLIATFAGLETPSRLRFLNGMILLYTPGWLSARVAEDLANRLFALHRRLPRLPSAGPLR